MNPKVRGPRFPCRFTILACPGLVLFCPVHGNEHFLGRCVDPWSESVWPFSVVIYIIFLDVTTKEAKFRKTILKRTQERSVNSTNDQFRFHTLQNFHLTFDLRQLSKISSFYPFSSNRKNVSTAAFSPKMRNKLRVEGLRRIYEPAKNEFCWFEFWDLY